MTRLFKAMSSTLRPPGFNLLEKLLTNIIECKDAAM